jgi:uncharacterized protein (DUF1778 family)
MSQSLPQWAIDGLAAAGLSVEGWEPTDGLPHCVALRCDEVEFRVYRQVGYLQLCVVGDPGLTTITRPPTIPDAFRLASRLASALENKPCERCKERANHELYIASNQEETIRQLEAENERLRLEHAHLKGAAQQAANIAYNSKGVNLKPENLERIVALLDEAVAHKAPAAPTEPGQGQEGEQE